MADQKENSTVQTEKQCLISITDLHKAYGEKQVLKGIDLDVYEGELFGFIGKNGVGKSTTIDCVIGSKKFQQGQILLDGFDIAVYTGHELCDVPAELLDRINYIKTGPFIEELRTTVKPFVGSTNQKFRRLR